MSSSSQDYVFNNLNFVDYVERYATGTDPIVVSESLSSDNRNSITQALTDALPSSFSGTIDEYFSQFNQSSVPFSSWSDFIKFITTQSLANAVIPETESAGVLSKFIIAYRNILDMGSGLPSDPLAGDWTDLNAALQAMVPPVAIDLEEEFIHSFNDFLYHYPYAVSASNPTGAVSGITEFLDNWSNYMRVTARIGQSTGSPTPINSFQQVYEQFGFDPSKFTERLAQFYQEQTDISTGGSTFFIPSQQFATWFEEMRRDYIQQNFLSSVDNASGEQLLVIDRVLRLLIQIIGILQQISVSQANQLSFLTDWQSAYTDQLTKIPTFLAGDNSPLGPRDPTQTLQDWLEKNRPEANSQMTAITTKVQAWRGQVQDQAKAMQSTINQSQDTANQQTQMATSILQQLSTLLSSIFR